MKKALQLLAVVMMALSVASCGGGAKVKEDIIVEDCIKIPKQNVALAVTEEKDEEESIVDLTATVKLENIKAVDETQIATMGGIIINLLDKDGVELIRLGSSLSTSLLTTQGKKQAVEFAVMWGNNASKERLEEIKEQTRTIVVAESQIMGE